MKRSPRKRVDPRPIPHTCMLAWRMVQEAGTIWDQKEQLKPVRIELKRHHLRLLPTDLTPWWMAHPREHPRVLFKLVHKHDLATALEMGSLHQCLTVAIDIIHRRQGVITPEVTNDVVSQD